jgi:hypothetical protein
MLKCYDLKVYPFLKNEIDNEIQVLKAVGFSDSKIDESVYELASNKDFTIIGLYQKAPRYVSGIEVYQEFYCGFSPKKQYVGLAVREEFQDITSPREFNIPIQGVGSNQLYIGGDFTSEVEVAQTHYILDTSNSYTILAALTVNGVVFNPQMGVTIVNYNPNSLTGIVQGDILYFQKGNRLTGLDSKIKWYDKNGTVVKEKTYKRRFEAAEASEYEYARRVRTVNQMIASADGTAIQPMVKTIYEHYVNPYINNYVAIGDAKAWKNAIDSEVNSQINAYLNIQIPFVDIDGNTTIKSIRNWIKDELYNGYK